LEILNLNISAIYGIRNIKNNMMYIGQSYNVRVRYLQHIRELRLGIHSNKHLQRSFNFYGENMFEICILDACEQELLPLKEQEWINKYQRHQLYNHVIDVQYRRGESNPNYGNKNTSSVKAMMAENRGKLKKKDVIDIIEMLKQGIPHNDIAKKFNIVRSAITRISTGNRWSHITGGPITPTVRRSNRPKQKEETKQKIANAIRGIVRSVETKLKIREAKFGKSIKKKKEVQYECWM
jgi:group I intron endonuclease